MLIFQPKDSMDFFSPKALDFLKDCAVVHRDVKPGSGKGVMKDGGAERVTKWSSEINFVKLFSSLSWSSTSFDLSSIIQHSFIHHYYHHSSFIIHYHPFYFHPHHLRSLHCCFFHVASSASSIHPLLDVQCRKIFPMPGVLIRQS